MNAPLRAVQMWLAQLHLRTMVSESNYCHNKTARNTLFAFMKEIYNDYSHIKLQDFWFTYFCGDLNKQ